MKQYNINDNYILDGKWFLSNKDINEKIKNILEETLEIQRYNSGLYYI